MPARRAFHLARERTVALRAVGVTVDRFLEADLQMELGFEPREAESGKRETDEPPSRPQLELREAGNGRAAELQAAMDRIRGRWGTKGVRVGR